MNEEFWEQPDEHRDLERLLESDFRSMLRAAPVWLAVAFGVLTVLGMLLLRPTGEVRPDLAEIGISPFVFSAAVTEVQVSPCANTAPGDEIQCQTVTFELADGPDAGSSITQEYTIAPGAPVFTVGDGVVLDYQPDNPDGFQYSYYDRQRRGVLFWVALAFGIAVVALGRMRGFAALIGLAGSVVVLLQFILPSILDGRPPVLVAIVGSAAIAYLALYTSHGFTKMTTVALLGTLGALGLTAVLSSIALGLAELSGFASEEAFFLTLIPGGFDISGLILAGVVIGSLGAIDDLTVTQASTIWELKAARPDMSPVELFRSGLRVGRDHIASTVNTLLLAYAGASMPLLLFFVLANQSLGTVLNSEVVATEALRTLLGSIGLVASVPLTTWLAAWVADEDSVGHHH